MSTKSTEYKQISHFLSSFTIEQHSPGSTVISSPQKTYLIRDIEISPSPQGHNSQQLNQIITTLYQHQTLTSKNILSLIDFDIIFNHTKTQTQIRAVYEYGKKSLSKEIQERKLTDEHFDQEALWGLMYSITTPLAYLQQKSIAYGVLDPSRVFLDNNTIAIIDPSSTGIDPYQIVSNRLYSPQLLSQDRCIESLQMFKSDVYVLGLMMLQCALLKLDLYSYDQSVIEICLNEIKDVYSENLCQLIEAMLAFEPETRPGFADILTSISDLFEISTTEVITLQPSAPDAQNQPNPICELDEYSERQTIDILQTEYIRFDDQRSNNHHNAHYKHSYASKIQRSPSELTQSMIEEASQYSETSSLCLDDSVEKSFEKNRRIYKPKEIKDRLVTQDYGLHSDRTHLRTESGHLTPQIDHINSERHRTNSLRDHSHSRISHHCDNEHSPAKSKTIRQLSTPTPQQEFHKQNFLKPIKRHEQIRPKQESKQNHLSKNNMVCFSPLNKDNLFTKPEIMKMIKNDIKRIQDKKKTGLSVHFSYFNQEQSKPSLNQDGVLMNYANTQRK